MDSFVQHIEPGAGTRVPESRDGLPDHATVALLRLRQNLVESEHKARLWKEQADETRAEYIQCKSNVKVLQLELESTKQELAQLRDAHRKQEELMSDRRLEIQSQDELEGTDVEDTRAKNDSRYEAKASALEIELKSTLSELIRIREEYESQEKLVEQLKEEKKKMEIELATRDQEPPKDLDLKEESAAQTGNIHEARRSLHGYAVEKPNKELGARRDEGADDSNRASPHRRSSLFPAGLSDLWIGPVENQIEKAKAEIATLKMENEQMEGAALVFEELYQLECIQHDEVSSQARLLEIELGAEKKRIEVLGQELNAVRDELTAVTQQLSDAVNLSEVRGRELKAAYASKSPAIRAYTISVKDVVHKVNALNTAIFEVASYLGESLIYDAPEPEAERRQQKATKGKGTYQCAMNLLGKMLAESLSQESLNGSNPILVQIVMQIALTNWCGSFGRWTEASNKSTGSETGVQSTESDDRLGISKQVDPDRLISALSDSIRDHEEQALAGRWGSLTSSHLPFSADGWDRSPMITIYSIMSVAGWSITSKEGFAWVEKRIGSIMKSLLDLNTATGKDGAPADLEIVTIPHGQHFDWLKMDDALAEKRYSFESRDETVVGTSGLGLQQVIEHNLKSWGMERKVEILLKPRVALERTINELLEPPPVSTRRTKKTTDEDVAQLGSLVWTLRLGL